MTTILLAQFSTGATFSMLLLVRLTIFIVGLNKRSVYSVSGKHCEVQGRFGFSWHIEWTRNSKKQILGLSS